MTPSRKGGPEASLAMVSPDIARQWASDRNGSVAPLDVHAGSPQKAWWKCVRGHIWLAAVRDRVRKRTGCPYCLGKKGCVENCISSVSARSKALWHPTKNLPYTPETVTPSSNRRFWWLCDRGHIWQAPPVHVVRRGTGCPHCRDYVDSKRERTCRRILEEFTGQPFPKSRPAWLVSSRGFQMELDGYAEGLHLAFEHHGVQHFRHTPFFQDLRKFERTQQLDAEKRVLCLARGVRLIEVRWDCSDLKGFLGSQLEGPS